MSRRLLGAGKRAILEGGSDGDQATPSPPEYNTPDNLFAADWNVKSIEHGAEAFRITFDILGLERKLLCHERSFTSSEPIPEGLSVPDLPTYCKVLAGLYGFTAKHEFREPTVEAFKRAFLLNLNITHVTGTRIEYDRHDVDTVYHSFLNVEREADLSGPVEGLLRLHDDEYAAAMFGTTDRAVLATVFRWFTGNPTMVRRKGNLNEDVPVTLHNSDNRFNIRTTPRTHTYRHAVGWVE